jgi:L-threonine kinase
MLAPEPTSASRSRVPPSTWEFAGHGSAPGTCGELVQGVTSEGEHVNVACPIERFSTADVRLRKAAETQVHGLRPDQGKMALAAGRALERLRVSPHEIHVAHRTDLDVGKGLGSSTADITAIARAVAAALGREISPQDIAAIATSIEPSDGTMFAGVHAVARDTGRVVRRFSWHPAFVIAMVVPPTTVDTASADLSGKGAVAAEFDEMLDVLALAADRRERQPFADQASRSAAINQRYAPNAAYALLQPRIARYGAAGIVIGHTGTVAGLLFVADADGRAAAAAASTDLQASLPREARVEVVQTPAAPV